MSYTTRLSPQKSRTKVVAGQRVQIEQGSYASLHAKSVAPLKASGAGPFKPKIQMGWHSIAEKDADESKKSPSVVPSLPLGRLSHHQRSLHDAKPSPRSLKPLKPATARTPDRVTGMTASKNVLKSPETSRETAVRPREKEEKGYANRRPSLTALTKTESPPNPRKVPEKFKESKNVEVPSDSGAKNEGIPKAKSRSVGATVSTMSDHERRQRVARLPEAPPSLFDVVCNVLKKTSGKGAKDAPPAPKTKTPKSARRRSANAPTPSRSKSTDTGEPAVPVKPAVTFLQHYTPMDKREEVISVLILSRLANLALSLVSKCVNTPCIRCVIPDLDRPDFEAPDSATVRQMRDAKIAIVDQEFFAALLRHARRLQWVHCTTRDSGTIAAQLAKVRADAIRKKMQSAVLKQKLVERRQELERQQKEMQDEVAQVEPALEKARSAMKSITKKHLDELRSFTNPPVLVRSCLHATFRMLASAQAADPRHGQLSWQEIRRITHKHGFIESVILFDPASLTVAVRERIHQDYLSRDTAAKLRKASYHASRVAGYLHEWILAQVGYAEVLDRVRPLKAMIEEAQREILAMEDDLQMVEELASESVPKYHLTRIGGAQGAMVAEYCLGRIIAYERDFDTMAVLQKEHKWQAPMTDRRPAEPDSDDEQDTKREKVVRVHRGYYPRPLTDTVLGVFGLGEVGGQVARLAKLSGMKVLALARRQRPLAKHTPEGDAGASRDSTPQKPHHSMKGTSLGVLASIGFGKEGRSAESDKNVVEGNVLRSGSGEDEMVGPAVQTASGHTVLDDPARQPLGPNLATAEWADECFIPGVPPERPGLRKVLSESDYIVLALPTTPDTVALLKGDALKHCKPSAVVINVGNGNVLPEDTLLKALDQGWIAGAVLDCVDHEPLPTTSRLWDHPNVILSPNVASIARREVREVVSSFVTNVRRRVNGRHLLHAIDWHDWDWSGARSRWKMLTGKVA